MKSYKGVFRKKDGKFRKMHFIKLSDMPKDFLTERLKGKKKLDMAPGLEVVWDLEEDDFRIFNWSTVMGEVTEEEVKIVL